jgi:hypothetical protein
MAITWTDKDRNVVRISHEGLVVRDRYVQVERVMSDIYSDETYSIVFNPTTGEDEKVHIGSCFELFQGPWGHAVEDLSPENVALRNAALNARAEQQRKEYEARCAREAEEARVREHDAPKIGKRMKVVRGRKVAPGTEGVVFWLKDGRVGLDLTGNKDATGRRIDVAWVDAGYLVNVEPLPPKA